MDIFINVIMMKNVFIGIVLLIALVAVTDAQRKNRRPTMSYQQKPLGLQLPDNATSIRENIVDTFSCDNRIYGYYADVDNGCQIFHICVPQTRHTTRYSFICPAETVFNQLTFVCTRTENSISCEESEKYYYLNERFGKIEGHTNETVTEHNGNEIGQTTRPSYPDHSTQRPTVPPQGTTTSTVTTPDNWTTQRPTPPPLPESTQYPSKPTYPTTTPNNSNSQWPTRPPTTTPDNWVTQYPQRPTGLPNQQTSTPGYPTTQYPPTSGTPEWLTPGYPTSSTSTPDYWNAQRPRRPTRPPNRPTTIQYYWTTQYAQKPPGPLVQNAKSWQYVDEDYLSY